MTLPAKGQLRLIGKYGSVSPPALKLHPVPETVTLDPVTLVLSGYWRASFTKLAVQPETPSAGDSANNGTLNTPPDVGVSVNGYKPFRIVNQYVQGNPVGGHPYISRTNFTMVMLIKANSLAADPGGDIRNKYCIHNDTNALFALTLTSSGMTCAYWDNNLVLSVESAPVPVSTGQWFMAALMFTSGTISASKNAGARVFSNGTGQLASAPGNQNFGSNYASSRFQPDLECLEIMMSKDAAFTDGTLALIRDSWRAKYGLTL